MAQKKTALVTGASSGIGFALAREFAQHGYNLLICAEDRDGLIEVSDRLHIEKNVKIDMVVADLSTVSGVEKLYEAAQAVGPIDVRAANAGVGVYGNFACETSLEEEMKMIDLNVKSVVHGVKNKIMAEFASLAPAPLVSAMNRKMTEPKRKAG